MALLTADDVTGKKFQATKFREGYDQDEVDDFLDEVVTTLRAVQTENDELKDKLAAAERRVAELSRAEAAASTTEPDDAGGQPDAGDEAAGAPTGTAAPAPGAGATPAGPSAPESATGMLLLAQKLHDDYVRSGQEESQRLLADAQSRADHIVGAAQETSQRTLAELEEERSLLERKIDELRVFERDYRTRLQSYLENLLGDLDSRGATLPPRAGQAAEGAQDGR